MAPCDFYLFGKMHLPMKGKRYADVEVIQKACTGILTAIPGNELKHCCWCWCCNDYVVAVWVINSRFVVLEFI